MKFLVILVVVVVALWWMLRRPRVSTDKAADARPKPATFVACAHCGVHLPSSDAVRDGDLHYCSDAHRLAGPSDHDPR